VTPAEYGALRASIGTGAIGVEVTPLQPDDLEAIGWSGSQSHLANVAVQLERVNTREVVYLAVRADPHVVAKGGVDFAKETATGTLYQLATHPRLEGLGLATRLVHELEMRAVERGIRRFRLDVELDNARARRLYEHLGYRRIGESEASWDAQAADGSRFLYTTTVTEMLKDA
jgi:ribosomal protein S18 acetylase RimI-like enzyme